MIIFTSSNCSRRAMARLYPKVVAFFFLIHEIMSYSQFTSIGKVKEVLFILTGGSVSPSSPNPFSHQGRRGTGLSCSPRSPLFRSPFRPPSDPPPVPLQKGEASGCFAFCSMGETRCCFAFVAWEKGNQRLQKHISTWLPSPLVGEGLGVRGL